MGRLFRTAQTWVAPPECRTCCCARRDVGSSRSQIRLDVLSIAYDSWQRMRGISSAHSVRGAPAPSLPDRGRSSIRSVRSRTSLGRISGASRRRPSQPSLAKPDLCSTTTYGIARRWPTAEPVFRLGRRFVGPVAFSSATRSPRDTHVRSAAAVRKPGGETYPNPLSGWPVKSIGRTCRPPMTASNSSSGTRSLRPQPMARLFLIEQLAADASS